MLHYTAMASCEAARDRLCDPAFEVSAHYLIGADGRIFGLVDEHMRAWHAGAGAWRGRGDVNSRSIGIELDNDGAAPFPEAQMAALEALLPGILERWSIPPAGVIAHSDMAPGRKVDPGPRFDWRRLARGGLSVWPTDLRPAPCDPAAFAAALSRIGYPEEVDPETLLSAFRLRFRPWGRGALSAADVAQAQAAALLHVDPGGASA